MNPKTELSRVLQASRTTLISNLADLSDYDVRRPLTPTGTRTNRGSTSLACIGRRVRIPM
ncbi:DinB family protein [Kribbella sindirgiensis]|uniref:DinB family protein n=1 Tax=Kribbella sindirgiensis TaxID=1124744 RepID=UPI001EE0D626|nr:DinB family protein [Kribbella sindirgiensis]